MATKVKPSRIHATWTPQNWQVLSYVSPDTFQWTNWGGGWWWDMYYNNFNWVTKTWSSFDLDLSSKYVPTWNFTVNAPSDIKEWQTYLLRVDNWATAYTMSLWTWITNLQWTDITLTPNAIDMFVFLATKDWNDPVKLELQKEINTSSWWWIYYFFLDDETDQTELDNLWDWYNTLPDDDEFEKSVIIIDYWNGSWQYPYDSPSWRYYYRTQDSADMYFFWDNYKLKVQFEMQWWYTRTGVYSVTIEPLYIAWTGISITGNEISSTVQWVPSGWTTGQVLTKTSGWIAWQNATLWWDVVWPSSATDWHLALFDWATGKLIKDGGVVPTWFNPANAGSANQILVKTAAWYQWKTWNVNSFPIPDIWDNMWGIIASAWMWEENITQVYAWELSSDCYIVTSYVHQSNSTDWYGHIIGVGCANNSGWNYTIWDARVRRIDIAFNATTQLCVSVTYTENIEPTVVSGDSGVTYTIKVSNSEPASWTASNIITLVP